MAQDATRSQSITGSNNIQVMGDENKITVIQPSPEVQEQNRVRFLAQLQAEYDKQWKQSIQGAALIELGLAEKPDAVLDHADLLLRLPQQPEHPLPAGTSIAQVYDSAGQRLLILGEPGAGKSTLLLDLARQLVERAREHAAQPLPVIFPLSSWAVRRLPFQDWLPLQLSRIYDVPLKVSRTWILTGQVGLLLDGLDEVPQEARIACIDAITAYREQQQVPLVVCCRRAEYEEIEQQRRLVLQNAVLVEPLTQQQVEDYLARAGQPLAAVRTALQANPVLRELATTPLMLSVLTLAYAGAHTQDLPQQGSAEAEQKEIFSCYVEQMVARKGDAKRYPLQSTRKWLDWLARQTQEHHITVFYLEHLQPDWLTPEQQRVYSRLAVRLPAVLIGALASLSVMLLIYPWFSVLLASYNWFGPFTILFAVLGGCLGWLFSSASIAQQEATLSGQEARHSRGRRIVTSTVIGLIVALSFGLDLGQGFSVADTLPDGIVFGAIFGLGSLLLQGMLQMSPASPSSPVQGTEQQQGRIARLLRTVHAKRALLAAAAMVLAFVLSDTWYNATSNGLLLGLGNGMIFGLILGLGGLLTSLILAAQAEGIHLTEHLKWTWISLGRSLVAPKHIRTTLSLAGMFAVSVWIGSGLLVGLIAEQFKGVSNGLLFGLAYRLTFALIAGSLLGLFLGLAFGVSLGLSYWFLAGLVQGVSNERVEDQLRRVPNQGIRRSFRNGVLMGVIGGIVVWMMGVLNYMLDSVLFYGFGGGVISGLRAGLRAGLSYLGSQLVIGIRNGLDFGLHFDLLLAAFSAILIWAMMGGLSTLRHYVIRLLLWRSGTFPLNAPRFLDDATTRVLLRRVGGGYSFVHRLILEYFASLNRPLTKH